MNNSNPADDAKKRPGATKVEIMPNITTAFDIKSTGFYTSLITGFFGILVMLNIPLPAPPEQITVEIAAVIATKGGWALVGYFIANFAGVAMVIYQKAKKKELNFTGLLGNVNLWLLLAGIATSGLMLWGLKFPDGALASLVRELYAGSYTGVASVFFGQLLNPIIRFIQSKRNQTGTLSTAGAR